MNTSTEQFLENLGWTVECESPLEIRHTDGSFASKNAADYVIESLKEEHDFNEKTNLFKKSGTRIQDLINHTNYLSSIVQVAQLEDNYACWEVAYNLVFSDDGSKRIRQMLNELNLSFDYYDPDTSYKEDVLAYTNALSEFTTTLTPFKDVGPEY